MISTLNGVVSEKLEGQVVLEVGGVGYGLFVSTEDNSNLVIGKNAKLYVFEQIREDIHDLYGFSSIKAKEFFELLLSVNGVGPRMALHMLSIGTIETISQAIAAGDTKYIQSAQGVGKRVAERVVVDLKDKVGLPSSVDETMFVGSSHAQQDEAVQGLLALGFDTQDALLALQGIDDSLPTEQRIREALKQRG